MLLRSGKLLLILLIPVLVYAGLKGVLYYNAKSTVDDIVMEASNKADIRYADISTDLLGAVTVSGISVQPVGFQDSLGIDTVRVASDDPMFFIRMAQWQPGESTPPNNLSFQVSGVNLPLASDLVKESIAALAVDELEKPCADGLSMSPDMLKKIGFTELGIDLDGSYRLNKDARTLDFGMDLELHDIESMHLTATLTDVDVETLARGAAPKVSLGGFNVAVRVSPEFGRRMLKACAMGSDETVQQWSDALAGMALADMQEQGITLGEGLDAAVRKFYQDWGEFSLVAAPPKPVGLFSLMFLPPQQLARALAFQVSLNDERIADTSFSWERQGAGGLSALLGGEQDVEPAKRGSPSRRILIQREYQTVAARDLARYVDHKVQIKPSGLPVREGVLKAVSDGEAQVQQTLHGGKYTVHVPLADIESARALVRLEQPPQN